MPEKYYAFQTKTQALECADQCLEYYLSFMLDDETYTATTTGWGGVVYNGDLSKWIVPVCYKQTVSGSKKGIRWNRGRLEEYNKVVSTGAVHNPWEYEIVTISEG